jgi:hypothetical protein
MTGRAMSAGTEDEPNSEVDSMMSSQAIANAMLVAGYFE